MHEFILDPLTKNRGIDWSRDFRYCREVGLAWQRSFSKSRLLYVDLPYKPRYRDRRGFTSGEFAKWSRVSRGRLSVSFKTGAAWFASRARDKPRIIIGALTNDMTRLDTIVSYLDEIFTPDVILRRVKSNFGNKVRNIIAHAEIFQAN